MLWGGSRSTKSCVFPCKVAAAGDESYFVCATVAAAVGLSFFSCRSVTVPWSCFGCVSVCVVLCVSWSCGCRSHWNGCMNVAWAMLRRGSQSTKPCVFPCKVAAGGDESYLVCATVAAAVGLSFFSCRTVTVPWSCFGCVSVCVVLCVSWSCGCRSHWNGCMNVAWAMLWRGSQSTKPCVFPCKVAAGGDESYLVCATVAAAVGLSFFSCRTVTVPWSCFGCVSVCVVLCVSWSCGCRSHWNGCMNVAWAMLRRGSQSTKPCVFPCKVAAGGDESYLVCATVAAAVGLSFFSCRSVTVPWSCFGCVSVCVVLCVSWSCGCRSHWNGCMNVAWAILWRGSQSTKPCVFPCKVAAGGDESYLVCATVAAAVGLSFFSCRTVTVPWSCFGCVSVCVVLCVSWSCGCRSHWNGCMNVAWAMLWRGSQSTKPCVFPCKVAAGDDERYLVCAAVAAAVGLSFFSCRTVTVPWSCFGCVSVCVVLCVSWSCGCRSHWNGCMNVAWAMLRRGSQSTKPCVFPCKVAAGDDERYLVCAAVAAAVGLSFFSCRSVTVLWSCFGCVSVCVVLCVSWSCGCRSHWNGCMNIAWAMLWRGSQSTKPCVFPCKVAAGDDERYLVCAAVAAAVGLSFFSCRTVTVPWSCFGCVSVCVVLCVSWSRGCRSHWNGCMNVAWAMLWRGSQSTKPCVFLCNPKALARLNSVY